MQRKPPLRLVGANDPANVFNDLDQLREEQQRPQRRERLTETFARIPHDRALDLYRHRVSGAAWLVLIELDRLIFKAGGRNPVKFSSRRLRQLGLRSQSRTRAFRELERAGVARVERLGPGMVPWVTHLWWPLWP
jgi:hypothetical protein